MGAGSTKPVEPGQRVVHALDYSKSSSDEPTESSIGFDTPPPQKRSSTRRKPAASGGTGTANGGTGSTAKRGAASCSRRSAAAGGGPGPDTRAASAADLNSQLDELDATFTSLGIVGRQLGGSASSPSSLQSSQTSCQLQQQLESQPEPLQQSSGSSGSRCSRERRRTQPFSWEERSDSQQQSWNYHKVGSGMHLLCVYIRARFQLTFWEHHE